MMTNYSVFLCHRFFNSGFDTCQKRFFLELWFYEISWQVLNPSFLNAQQKQTRRSWGVWVGFLGFWFLSNILDVWVNAFPGNEREKFHVWTQKMEMVAQPLHVRKLHIWDSRKHNYRCREMYNLLTSADVLLELNVDWFSSVLYDFSIFGLCLMLWSF